MCAHATSASNRCICRHHCCHCCLDRCLRLCRPPSLLTSQVLGRSHLPIYPSSHLGILAVAGLAELVTGGDLQTSDLIEQAASSFKLIDYAVLSKHFVQEEDHEYHGHVFAPRPPFSEDAEEAARQKKHWDEDNAALAKSADLGDGDAFISHSWSDSMRSLDKKEALFHQFCKQFMEEHGGKQPFCWIDKFCLDQKDLDVSLACLPIFLMSCRTLVILAGPTWSDRLWCIFELFCFIRMGGTIDRVHVVHFGDERLSISSKSKMRSSRASRSIMSVAPRTTRRNSNQVLMRFGVFNAEMLECTEQSDREKLLQIIEEQIGLSEFNEQVRHFIAQAIERQRHSRDSRSLRDSVEQDGRGKKRAMTRFRRKPANSGGANYDRCSNERSAIENMAKELVKRSSSSQTLLKAKKAGQSSRAFPLHFRAPTAVKQRPKSSAAGQQAAFPAQKQPQGHAIQI